MDPRQEFLLEMYKQMMADINRHIMVVWQSVGVLIGALAVFSLVEKNVISLDIAAALIVLLCGWLTAHLLDAGYWYNRNLVIIANIERQFLVEADLKEIHYYFGKHRVKNRMIMHLRIQMALGVGLSALVVLFHFFERVAPGFSAPISNFELRRALPYLIVVCVVIYVRFVNRHRDESYEEFIRNSPGKSIDTTGIAYRRGHGQREGERSGR